MQLTACQSRRSAGPIAGNCGEGEAEDMGRELLGRNADRCGDVGKRLTVIADGAKDLGKELR